MSDHLDLCAAVVTALEEEHVVAGERGAWRRHEADGHVTHVASGTDRTPVHFQYPRGYDSRCGWCYLNCDWHRFRLMHQVRK